MTGVHTFALVLLAGAGSGLLIVVASRFTARIGLPLPAVVLVGSAVAAASVAGLHATRLAGVDDVVTVALVGILFDGGMGIGWRNLRSAWVPVASVGILGTFATAAAGGVVVHGVVGSGWYPSLLLATAVAPTDPTVVFSVLGNRRIAGRSATILEGESGVNDPVGIALMASLVAAGGLSAGAAGHAAGDFALQMAVGAAVGIVGGRLLLVFIRRVPLPGEGLYPLRTLASAFVLYGLATAAHGSGFLAVFLAGVALGDGRAPFKREIERFHDAVASLGEIIAFVVLGLTVRLGVEARTDVWLPGLLIGVALLVVLRPVVVGLAMAPVHLRRNERAFVLFAGLKGAVPILLGGYLLAAHVPGASRLYGIVVVVVLFSVVVQGGLIGAFARLVHLPMEILAPEPWALGVRLRQRPEGVYRLRVAHGAPVAGCRVATLPGLPDGAWITLLVRDGRLVTVRGDTRLEPGDEVTVLAAAGESGRLEAAFGLPDP